jgi:hypothetical protein
LVVVDEAHRLHNVYKKSNKIARMIRDAIGVRPKVLLTATLLQNYQMELFGPVSFVDPHIFGSEDYFRSQFAKRASEMGSDEFNKLRARIQPICQRALRRQVLHEPYFHHPGFHARRRSLSRLPNNQPFLLNRRKCKLSACGWFDRRHALAPAWAGLSNLSKKM